MQSPGTRPTTHDAPARDGLASLPPAGFDLRGGRLARVPERPIREHVVVPLNSDMYQLLDKVPADGSRISNVALRQALRWNENRYFRARDELLATGQIVRSSGRGGTVRRAASTPTEEAPTAPNPVEVAGQVEEEVRSELDLYEPMRKVIAGDWARDHRWEPIAVDVTAQQGRRATGGTWSRPDIVSVEVRTFSYVPGKHLEVTTFEVKPASAITVQAVYEALAHRRAATRSYVLLHVPPDHPELDDAVDDVAAVARSHGVGVITAGEPHNYQTWEEREEAHRIEPDPERLDQFIATQLPDRTKTAISKALR